MAKTLKEAQDQLTIEVAFMNNGTSVSALAALNSTVVSLTQQLTQALRTITALQTSVARLAVNGTAAAASISSLQAAQRVTNSTIVAMRAEFTSMETAHNALIIKVDLLTTQVGQS